MAEHRLKIWPKFFVHVLDGSKVHELRRNDRDFHVGDILRLQEYCPHGQEYSGRETMAEVTYITSSANACALSPIGLDPSYCILSIKPLPTPPKEQ